MTLNSTNESSSSYTNAAYSSKGVSGLASGIDTESLVQSMLSGVQNKIDKQTQKQKQIEFKQEAYRDVITSINDFKSKYFSLTSNSSIRLASLYGSMEAESSTKAVSVTAANGGEDANFNIQVARLATKTSVSSSKASTGTINSSASVADTAKAQSFKYERTVNIKIGDTTAKADLTGISDASEACSRINAAAGKNIVSTTDSVAVTSADGKALTQKFYRGGSEYTGSVKITTNTTYTDADGNALTYNKDENKYYKANGEEFTDTASVKSHTTATYKDESGNELNVKYFDSENNEYTGDVNTSANVVSKLTFTNDEEFELSGTAAGMAILGLGETVKSTAAKDEDGNTIDNKFEVTSTGFNANFAEVGKASGTVDICLDGVTKSFEIKEGESMTDLADKVKKSFGTTISFTQDSSTGAWNISAAGTGRQLSISAKADTMEAIGFGSNTTTVANQMLRTDSAAKLGIGTEGDTTTEYSFSINGCDIKYTAEDSISSIMNKINSSDAGVTMSYNDLSDKFSIASNSTGEGFDISISGDDEGLFAKLGFTMSGEDLDVGSVKAGQNAIVNIDGVTVERASNDFAYNGMNISLKSTTGNYLDENGNFTENSDGSLATVDGSVDNKAEINTKRDVTKIVDTLKAFVEDYNKLIEDLNKKIHEDADYKKYPPLTDAQKKEMSDKEIELWEEKTKVGLLRNDKDISTFLTEMRSAMYTKGDSKFVLSNIGINSSSEWSDFGKLSIDEDTLKKALQSEPNEVAKIFVGDNGLATKLNKICDKCAGTSSGAPGALVQIAGVKGKGTEKNNQMQKELDSIKERLAKLNLTYETRKERFWKSFNAMEQAISSMNSQGDQLSNFFM